MAENDQEQLAQRYRHLDENELMSLYLRGELTDAAMAAAKSELNYRGFGNQFLLIQRKRYLTSLSRSQLQELAAIDDINHITKQSASTVLEAKNVEIQDWNTELAPRRGGWMALAQVFIAIFVVKFTVYMFLGLFHAAVWSTPADKRCQEHGYWYAHTDYEASVVLGRDFVSSNVECGKWTPLAGSQRAWTVPSSILQ